MAIHYFTDKNSTDYKKEIFPSAYMAESIKVCAGDKPTVQNHLGLGVAITGSSCYLLSKMDKEKRRAILEDLYSPKGLNLSIGRLSVGASDYSAELYSYDEVPFDTELKHFSIEKDEKYIIPVIKEILEIRPDLYLFASPWSPPSWMKTGGSLCGGYMREEFIDCYADYIIKYIEAYAAHGIKISALTPQNEPETQQSGHMTACDWHPEIEAKYVKILKKKLREKNMDVKVWLFDHCFDNVHRVMWGLDNLQGLKEDCDGVAFHYYSGCIEQTVAITEKYPELELHFTEGGPRLYDNYETDFCKWVIMFAKAVRCGYKSFTGWNLILDEHSEPCIGPFYCGGLITEHSITGELSYSGQYKAFRHMTPYINKNSKLYPIVTNEVNKSAMCCFPNTGTPIDGFMIDNGDGKKIFVLANSDSNRKQIQLEVNGTLWYTQLQPDTVATIII